MKRMVKKRSLLVSFYLICLATICCHVATATSQIDCRRLHIQQCVGNYWNKAFCCYMYLFNVSTNDPVIRTTIDLQFSRPISIVSAYTNNDDVQVYCNTQGITLEIPKDYQEARDLEIHVTYRYKYTYYVLVRAKIYDTRLTGQVIQMGENRQIILNCSVAGFYNKNSIKEFQFNDNPLYSCSKTGWSKVPKGSANTPYTRLLDDGTTCQLIIPKATEADFINHRCRVKFQIGFKQSCYLLSEPYEAPSITILTGEPLMTTNPGVTPTAILEEVFRTGGNDPNTVTKIEAFAISGVVLVSIIVTVIVVAVIKYSCQRKRRQLPMEVHLHVNNPQLLEHLLNVAQQGEEGNDNVNGNNFNDERNYGACRHEPQAGGNDNNPRPNAGNDNGGGNNNGNIEGNDPNGGDNDGEDGADNNGQIPPNNEENNNQGNREIQEGSIVHSRSYENSGDNEASGVSRESGGSEDSKGSGDSNNSGQRNSPVRSNLKELQAH